jgi:hypothetical protein
VALLAAALDDDVAGAIATGLPASLEELIAERTTVSPMAFGFRALEVFDLPDLVRIAAPRPLLTGAAGDEAALIDRLLEAVAA